MNIDPWIVRAIIYQDIAIAYLQFCYKIIPFRAPPERTNQPPCGKNQGEENGIKT
jgi:hypothetical protein